MGQVTGIAWTDATMNFWIGCTKVGPGCDLCYAEVLARNRLNVAWGAGAPRRRTSEALWNQLDRWDRMQVEYQALFSGSEVPRSPGVDRRIERYRDGSLVPPLWVFCSSLSDFFDNEVMPEWRLDAWARIRRNPNLRFQIVTKRIGNAAKMLPPDWREGQAYRHVGIIATIVTPEEWNRDVRKLVDLRRDHNVRWVGISAEPLVEGFNWRLAKASSSLPWDPGAERVRISGVAEPAISWLILGGESDADRAIAEPRPFSIAAASTMLAQAQTVGTAVFVKQLGRRPVLAGGTALALQDRAGADPEEWPAHLRVREMPRIY